MQLHVLGPAFGLPSIDAECIAAISLLQLWAKDDFELIPSHDPTQKVPFLRDGEYSVSGFKNILNFLEVKDPSSSSSLTESQRADSIAISSFLESHAQTLLDISLYVSFENYSATRTSFTKILPWYSNYIIPPKRREAARQRTEHLGILSIDVDDVHEDLSNSLEVGKEKPFEAETQKKANSLLMKRNTVSSFLRKPEHSAVFKLHALADNFFGPLQDMLGDRAHLLGTDLPQAVDCLAYGYLSLMLYPTLPQDWLNKTLRRKYSKLVRYIERMHERFSFAALPWEAPVNAGVLDVATTITKDLISRIPLLGPKSELIPMCSRPVQVWRRYVPAILVATGASLGLFGYFALKTGWLIWPHGEEVQIFGKRRLADYGHIGAALAGISFVGQQAAQNADIYHTQVGDTPLSVEVEVEKDGVP